MLCSSVIIGPKPTWLEFWTHLVIPGVNYVEVKRDWSDLFEKYAELEAEPQRAEAIARKTKKIAKLLDPRGVNCYIWELIRRYSSVCSWEVEEPGSANLHKEKPRREWIGVEDFLVNKIRY
jgi:hypothetical protein